MDIFASGLRNKALSDHFGKGDSVRVVGRDKHKGMIGVITKVKDESGEQLFTVELQATGEFIERTKRSIRKEYS